MENVYSCVPKSFERKQADPFDYKLRSMAEVQEQMKYYAPNFPVMAEYKRYTAGDIRQNNPNNIDDRERVSKLMINLRDLKLAPLQRERFIFLLGPRYNPKKPHEVKIVTK